MATGSRLSACRRRAGFTLVELLVVMAIIATLAGLITTAVQRGLIRAQRTQCQNRLGQIGKAAILYAQDHRGRFPWVGRQRGAGELSGDDEVRACLERLHTGDYLDDPAAYVCPASYDEAPAYIEDRKERSAAFHLEEHTCSYTWRSRPTAAGDSSRTPISGDKRGGETVPTNHRGGRNVLFKGGNVAWFDQEVLEGQGDDARRLRRELVGFGLD